MGKMWLDQREWVEDAAHPDGEAPQRWKVTVEHAELSIRSITGDAAVDGQMFEERHRVRDTEALRACGS